MIDSRIDSIINVDYVYHTPKNYAQNPVLKADKQWELNANKDPYAAPFHLTYRFCDKSSLKYHIP